MRNPEASVAVAAVKGISDAVEQLLRRSYILHVS